MAQREKRTLAAQAWRHIFSFVVATVDSRDRVLERLDLTPGDSRVLLSLDVRDGRTMRSLADEWDCDASTATWMVARLADRGLVARRAVPGDRRLRLILLTPQGARTKRELLSKLFAPPPVLLEMGGDELRALVDATKELPTKAVRPSPVSAPRGRAHRPGRRGRNRV
ncbi:MAG TPA: MarR family transcriptional regulator [Candidatus Acidoferrales bacterium]|nr:MarR family transcriptional regulator [Candidatus Acidoferrales bacterium]